MARILVVDNDAGTRVVMRAILEQDGFVNEEAPSGTAALDAVRGGAPDLILLDLMMPGVDGYEFLRRLRADPKNGTTPVVVISAKGATERGEALAAGADDYFEKPFSPLALLRVVEATLGPEAAAAGRP